MAKFRTHFILLTIFLLLSPLAATLRTQTPWNCFQTTIDEGLFFRAIYHWQQGLGFGFEPSGPPFDAGLTIGLPMAWGATLIQSLTKWDLVQAGRFWVYLCFLLLCASVFALTLKRTRSTGAAVLGLATFGFFWNQIPAANYPVFGILGEVPAALVFCWAASLLNSKKLRVSAAVGALAFLTFWIKPSFLFAPFALGLVIAIPDSGLLNKASIKSAASRVLAFGLTFAALYFAYLIYVSTQRHETVSQFLRNYLQTSVSISLHSPNPFGIIEHLFNGSMAHSFLYLIALTFAGVLIKQKKLLLDRQQLAHLTFGLSGIALYLFTQKTPVPKQWVVFAQSFVLFVSFAVSSWSAHMLVKNRELALNLRKTLAILVPTLIVTWLINVPGLVRRTYINQPTDSCPVKEQEHIRKVYEDLYKNGTPLSKLTLEAEASSSLFLYSLPALDYMRTQATHATTKSNADTDVESPKWVAGDLVTLKTRVSSECVLHWSGSIFGVYRCH